MVRPTFQTTSCRSTTPNLGSGHGTTKKKTVRFTNSTRDTPRTLPKNSGEQITNQYTGPTTRSRDNTLPPPINRFTAMVNAPQDEVTQIARQPPMDLTSLWGSNNSLSTDATFATEFRTILAQNQFPLPK
jgi:hypothetical protein